MILARAGSLSLAYARQLPPGRSLYTHNRVGTKKFSTILCVRRRVVEDVDPYNISIIKYGQSGFPRICGEFGGRQIAVRVDTGILPSPFGSKESGVGCRKPSKTI